VAVLRIGDETLTSSGSVVSVPSSGDETLNCELIVAV
jgi:hypothetical protein